MTHVIIRPGDAAWREELREAIPPPERLYLRGRLPGLQGIGVVGTRRMSAYGKACVDLLVPEIIRLGLPVVSGLALGIDGAAHDAALQANGITVAVIGSGLDDDSIYPRAHAMLAKRMLENDGALLSEYAPGSPSFPHHFPERNRLIAALSKAVLVIEAPKKSGAMITARLALEMGRDVWAVPGPITHPNAEGPNLLIRDGATPICGPDDIAAALGLKPRPAPAGAGPRQAVLPTFDAFSPEERLVLEKMAAGAETADALARSLGRSVTAISTVLTALELKGAVRTVGGARYTFYT